MTTASQRPQQAENNNAIPAHMGELDAAWLTAQLRSCRAIDEANYVEQFEIDPLGDGEGFIGELGRIRLSYASEAPRAPASVIAKTPSRILQNRGLGVMMGAYENEIRFYSELAAHVGVRVPECYAAVATPEPRSAAIANRIVSRLPGGLALRALGPLTRAAAKTPRRFGLLIEDLDGLAVGDQVAGADVETASIALRHLARLHANTWESQLLDQPWLRAADNNAAFTQALFRRAWPIFRERYDSVLPPEVVRLGEYLLDNGEALLKRMARAPRTLNHGDFRLDNLLFDPADRDQVTIIDWQVITAGNPMPDVSYFLRTNLLPDVADRVEQDLLRAYHEGLAEHGVKDYSLEAALADYRLALAWLLHRGALLVGLLDMSHDRGQAIVDRAIERSVPAVATVTQQELRAAGI